MTTAAQRARRRILTGDGYDSDHVIDQVVDRMIDQHWKPARPERGVTTPPQSRSARVARSVPGRAASTAYGAGRDVNSVRSRGVGRLRAFWEMLAWAWAVWRDTRDGRETEHERGG